MLYWIITHRRLLTILITMIGCGVIAISTWVFGNDYYNTEWHYVVSFIGLFLLGFIHFCIVDETVIKMHNEDNERVKAQRPGDNTGSRPEKK